MFTERDNVKYPTPLAKMLRGGRGGQVRLKLYLSILWLAAAPPHDVAYPARAWASLLDLEDPSGRGARRINDAIAWLEANSFVTVEDQPGHPNRVTLLNELGKNPDTGRSRRYTIPGAAYNKLAAKAAEPEKLRLHRYIKIDARFWTSGWMACLSGAAVSMYLVLLAEQGLRGEGAELWFSPDAAIKRYSLSDDTRSKGLNELRRAGLINTLRRPVATDIFDVQRFRNVYILNPERLAQPAELPAVRPSYDDEFDLA
jgi:hypothetical protein